MSWRDIPVGSLAFWIQSVVFFVLSYFSFVRFSSFALFLLLFLLWWQVYLKKSW